LETVLFKCYYWGEVYPLINLFTFFRYNYYGNKKTISIKSWEDKKMKYESKIIDLIALDRLNMPLSSMEQKLRRGRLSEAKNIANSVGYDGFQGERVFAYVQEDETNKARGMKEAIAEFGEEFPKYGDILKGKIAEKRAVKKNNLYFGVQDDCRLTKNDYMTAMESIGFTDHMSHRMYPILMEVSRNLKQKRNESRNILIGK
jgi:hypothetical protein